MLIICPHCATSYQVEPSSLGANGRPVRCVRCGTVWFAQAPTPDAEAEVAGAASAFAAESLEPQRPWPDQADAAPDEPPAVTAETEPQDEAADPTVASLSDPEQPPREAEPAFSDTMAPPVEIDHRGPVDMIEAPPIVPPQEPEPGLDTSEDARFAHDGHDLEKLVARRARRILARKRKRIPAFGLPALILVLASIVASLLLWRKDVVRVAPQSASLYAAIGLPVNLRGLAFTGIRTSKEMQDGIPVLVVEGQIVSESRQPVEVPRLRFAIRNAAGYEIYSWTTLASRSALGPGEAIDFRSRLASPPAEGRDVSVRFFNRRDMLSGLR